MNDLELQVLQAVTTTPGRQAKQIAAQLGFERQAVNSALYGSLKSKVRQDKSYRWYTRDSTGIDGKDDVSPRPLDTTLGRLCRYYLDCLSHDDLGGVSEFASSKFGGPSYAELGTLPMFDANGKCQGSCRIMLHTAVRLSCRRSVDSGLRRTSGTGSQLRAGPLQRLGRSVRAASYTA